MKGIILRTETKENFQDLTIGEIGFISDTNELVVQENGPKYRPIIAEVSNSIFKNSGFPSGGKNGDLVLDLNVGEHKEYYNQNNTWKTRYEGYSEDYLLSNFESKVVPPTPDEYVKIDGTTAFNIGFDESTSDSIISKTFADGLVGGDLSTSMKTDGTTQMVPQYVPTLAGDVINLAHLSGGQFVMIPPTSKPGIPGVIWNDNGVVKIDDGVDYIWEINGNTLRQMDVDPINGNIVCRVGNANFVNIYDYTGESFKQCVHTIWGDVNGVQSVFIYGDYVIMVINETVELFNISGITGIRLASFTSPSTNFQFFGASMGICSTRFIVADTSGDTNATGEAFVYDLTGSLQFSLVSPHEFPSDYGSSVAISENYILVTDYAPYNQTEGISSGEAYLYNQTGSLLKTIPCPEAQNFDYFGTACAISEPQGVIVIGAGQGGVDYNGKVWIYTLSGTLVTELVVPNRDNLSGFGSWETIHINDITGYITIGTDSKEAFVYDVTGSLIFHSVRDEVGYGHWVGTYNNNLYSPSNYSIDISHNGPIVVVPLP